MSRFKHLLVMMIMFAAINNIEAGASELVNGSFEEDGTRIVDITIQEPNGWDVNLPADKFGGTIDNYWVTDGDYSLTIYSNAYETFEANDIGYVYQYVHLRDVNQIVLDLNLDTYPIFYGWDPVLRTAVLMIDDVVVWESNSVGTDVRGEYLDEIIEIYNDDSGLHKVAIGLRCDVNESSQPIQYYADWDNIRFDLYCGGNGFLAGDFSRDCYVNFVDYAMLADVWHQRVDPNSKYNLSREGDVERYGIVNFRDYAVLANTRDSNDLSDLEAFTGLWLDEVKPDNEWNLFIGDIETHGIINFKDYAVLANVYDGNDLSALEEFTGVWLHKVPVEDEWNLFRGDDVQPSGVINFADLAVFVNDWIKSSYD